MKNAGLIGILFVIGMPGVARAADVSSATVQGQIADWSFIQSKGGIKLGLALQHTATSWQLPLECDLSTDSSGILIQKTVVQQEKGSIFISFVIGQTVWTLTPERGKCRPLTIESVQGVHPVFYRDGAGKTYYIGNAAFNQDSSVLSHPGG